MVALRRRGGSPVWKAAAASVVLAATFFSAVPAIRTAQFASSVRIPIGALAGVRSAAAISAPLRATAMAAGASRSSATLIVPLRTRQSASGAVSHSGGLILPVRVREGASVAVRAIGATLVRARGGVGVGAAVRGSAGLLASWRSYAALVGAAINGSSRSGVVHVPLRWTIAGVGVVVPQVLGADALLIVDLRTSLVMSGRAVPPAIVGIIGWTRALAPALAYERAIAPAVRFTSRVAPALTWERGIWVRRG